jgi:hypothetical protein
MVGLNGGDCVPWGLYVTKQRGFNLEISVLPGDNTSGKRVAVFKHNVVAHGSKRTKEYKNGEKTTKHQELRREMYIPFLKGVSVVRKRLGNEKYFGCKPKLRSAWRGEVALWDIVFQPNSSNVRRVAASNQTPEENFVPRSG